jgi:translation initiation factor 2A
VISGSQPATATLYGSDCSPLFEFGKRYRNTIRISPFSDAILIGGFGNLVGETDFWSLSQLKELGQMKAHCTVSVEWAPDGKHLMTGVLYERVKQDNELKIFLANGDLLLTKEFKN